MNETPEFEGPLRNPDLSENDDRKLDRLMDPGGLPAAAARKIVGEVEETGDQPQESPTEHNEPAKREGLID